MLLEELTASQQKLVSVGPEASVRTAAEAMAQANVGCTAVLDAGKLVGILTERDLVRQVLIKNLDADGTQVSEVMTQKVVTGKAKDSIGTAAQLMYENHVRHLPVVDKKGALLGLLSIRDVLQKKIQDMRDYIGQRDG